MAKSGEIPQMERQVEHELERYKSLVLRFEAVEDEHLQTIAPILYYREDEERVIDKFEYAGCTLASILYTQNEKLECLIRQLENSTKAVQL